MSKKTKEATFVRKWHSAVAKSEKEKEKEKEKEREKEREREREGEYISNSVWRHGQKVVKNKNKNKNKNQQTK